MAVCRVQEKARSGQMDKEIPWMTQSYKLQIFQRQSSKCLVDQRPTLTTASLESWKERCKWKPEGLCDHARQSQICIVRKRIGKTPESIFGTEKWGHRLSLTGTLLTTVGLDWTAVYPTWASFRGWHSCAAARPAARMLLDPTIKQ